MANAYLRYEIFDPIEPNAAPRGDALGPVYASGNVATQRAEFTNPNDPATQTAPSVPSAPFVIPPSPIGARRVLVRLFATHERILVTTARNPAVVGGASDPPIPVTPTQVGPDPVPMIVVEQLASTLLVLQPGDKLRARAGY